MRKVLISLAAAASALVVASPAAAQWAPAPQPYGYGYGAPAYGAPAYGYGYNRYGEVRALQMRIDAIQRQIRILDQRRILSNREGRALRDSSRYVERQLQRAARYGLSQWEARDMQYRIAMLERNVQRQATDGDGRFGNGYGYYGRRY